MKKELPYRIAKLLVAQFSSVITEEERIELSLWRVEKPDNEELFQQVIRGDRFKTYLQRFAEHDFHAKFALLERKMKRAHRRMVMRRISYAAVMIPFILLLVWVGGERFTSDKTVCVSTIVPGHAKAMLTFADGRTVYFDERGKQERLDSNVIIDQDTLRYSKHSFLNVSDLHTLSVPRGGEFFVTLADGTKVWLNSETEFRYPSDFVSAERRVFLRGEAYFEVVHDEDRPFIVESREQCVCVLGTAFAVRAYPEESTILTTLERGSVRVRDKKGNVILKPGEQSVVNGDSIVVKPVNVFEYTAWRNGKFIFIDKPLNEIMSILSRWYDIDVFYASLELGEIRFTGELVRYSNVEELLQKFEILEKVKFNVKDRTIVVKKY